MNPDIEQSWKEVLYDEFRKPYFPVLKNFLIEEKKKFRIYPPGNRIFAALNHTPFYKVKVVILGQDPYHGPGQAHGLCFSVPKGVQIPPSLRNIFTELNNDLNIPVPKHGNLEKWADQGVLLLNATLTVRANQAGSHQKKGWEIFTDSVIKILSSHREKIVFLLWGNYAMQKSALINSDKHLILKTVHPSPLSASRGFFGCCHFSKTNDYLKYNNIAPIDWDLNSV
ncbi:MAG: uracil-DNA glycosylase [Bacteroidales bacterium]